MSNALHDYAKLFERYAANNGGTGAILAGEDCLSLANEMRMDADAIDAENAELQETLHRRTKQFEGMCEMWVERGVENHKLRELARDMWEACPADGYYCIHHCKHYDKESESHCKLEDRMRELGVVE